MGTHCVITPDFAIAKSARKLTNENPSGIFIVFVGVSQKICHTFSNANFGIVLIKSVL